MTTTGWLLFVLGTLFSITAMGAFLYTLWLGLNRNRWWPLGLVATLWVMAMAAYSLWDGKARQQMQRQRIEILSSETQAAARQELRSGKDVHISSSN